MVDNYYINGLLKRMPHFGGVYSSDNIPPLMQLAEHSLKYIIVNTARETEPGEHFIALLFDWSKKRPRCLWFDSFGMTPANNDILAYLRKSNVIITWTKKAIQHPLSSYCGFFCIGAIAAHQLHGGLKSFFKLFFPSEKEHNDKIIVKYLIRTLNKCLI